MEVLAASPVIETAPLGPSRRRYANGVALVRSKREPDEMLHKLRKIEHKFGRRRLGRAWGRACWTLISCSGTAAPGRAERARKALSCLTPPSARVISCSARPGELPAPGVTL